MCSSDLGLVRPPIPRSSCRNTGGSLLSHLRGRDEEGCRSGGKWSPFIFLPAYEDDHVGAARGPPLNGQTGSPGTLDSVMAEAVTTCLHCHLLPRGLSHFPTFWAISTENGDALRNDFSQNLLHRNSPCLADLLGWAAPLPGRRPSLLLQHPSPKVLVANGPVLPAHRLLIWVFVQQKRPP